MSHSTEFNAAMAEVSAAHDEATNRLHVAIEKLHQQVDELMMENVSLMTNRDELKLKDARILVLEDRVKTLEQELSRYSIHPFADKFSQLLDELRDVADAQDLRLQSQSNSMSSATLVVNEPADLSVGASGGGGAPLSTEIERVSLSRVLGLPRSASTALAEFVAPTSAVTSSSGHTTSSICAVS